MLNESIDIELNVIILKKIIESLDLDLLMVYNNKIILASGIDKYIKLNNRKIIGSELKDNPDVVALLKTARNVSITEDAKKYDLYMIRNETCYNNILNIVDTIPAGAVYLNSKGDVIKINTQAYEISKIYNQSLIDNKDLCINSFFLNERILSDFYQCVNDGKVFENVKELMAIEKTVYFFEYSFIPIYNKSEGNHVLFIIQDKSDELVKQEELIKILTALDNTGVGIITTDHKYNISYVNRSAVNLWGFDNNGNMINNNNLKNLLDEESVNKLLGHWNKMVSERVYYFSDEMMAKSKNGSMFPVEVKATLITDTDEKPVGISLSVSDISEQIASRDELVKAKEMAEESDRLKSAFLANMSHEIRTPMNGILGFSNLLKKKNLHDDLRDKYINLINTNGELLIKIIDDIIDLAKIESGQLQIVENECNINNLFLEILHYFERYMKKYNKTNISLLCNENQSINTNVILDSLRLKQVLFNMVENAIKFTSDGRVEFGCELDNNNFINFYVKDTGIGIPYEKQQIIFDRFLQLDYSPAREHGGTGLGLTICKYLVEMMNGKIWVESKPGEGACFNFTVPFKPVIAENGMYPEPEDDMNYNVNWSDKNILITEDEENNYYLLEEFLRDSGANIYWARDGLESIEMFKNNEFDLVLLDIKIPNLSGYEVVKELKKINPKVPVIAQTAYALTGDKEKILKAGCDDYVSKPIEMLSIINVINKHLK